MLTYKTAGESHGQGLAALVDGFPAGVRLEKARIDAELQRRQGGYGRGARQAIERDSVAIQSGILHGVSTGAPILLWVPNRDFKIESMPELVSPRPGHADLAGAMKYQNGIRGILERASARETAARVAAGALAATLLELFGIQTVGYVTEIGGIDLSLDEKTVNGFSPKQLATRRSRSSVYSLDATRDSRVEKEIDTCRDEGETLGGVLEVRVFGLPVGLGSHAQFDRKLDAQLAGAAMSIQAIKGVEIGLGFESARRKGSAVHDPICRRTKKFAAPPFARPTNHAGGIEGGMSNGEPILVRAAMKPIATLKKRLDSVNFLTGKKTKAAFERSDVCAVSAASVVLENVIAFEIAVALLKKLGGDSLRELTEQFSLLQKTDREFLNRPT